VAGLLVALWMAALLPAGGDRNASPAAGTFRPTDPAVVTAVTAEVPSTGFWLGSPEHVTGGFEFELAQNLSENPWSIRDQMIYLKPASAGASRAAHLLRPAPLWWWRRADSNRRPPACKA
jgi:hypothetical protein